MAFPEFTIKAKPLLFFENPASFSWQSKTALDRVDDLVKTPAIEDNGDIEASIVSVRFLYFTPEAQAEKVTPLTIGRFGKPPFGARGDIFICLDILVLTLKITFQLIQYFLL